MENIKQGSCILCGDVTEDNYQSIDCQGRVTIIPACSKVCAEAFFSYHEQCTYVFDEQGFA